LSTIFNTDLSPDNIIQNISLYIGKKIHSENTLIFFDEIQECPKAISSLKYFCEQAQEFHVIAAGSLLGVSVGLKNSFPVGKVNFMTLYPLNYEEYLLANKEDLLVDKLKNIKEIETFPEIIHIKLINYLKTYLFTGGMPEVVQNYINNKNIKTVREIQNEILEAYKRDFSKYTNSGDTVRITELWSSIPSQLSRENKKFKYNEVKKNARASQYLQTIVWLKNAGLVHLAYNVTSPKLPLSGYSDKTKFKIFLLDTGLLGAMLNLSSANIIEPNKLFTEYKGAFIENYVACELKKLRENELYYWTSKSDAEVDFLIEDHDEIYPVEVKSGLSRNKKSLLSYKNKYNPKLIFRTSPRNYKQQDNFINIPLYGISFFLFKETSKSLLNTESQ